MSKLIECAECDHHPVAKDADQCPNCGTKKFNRISNILSKFGTAFFVLACCFVIWLIYTYQGEQLKQGVSFFESAIEFIKQKLM